MNNKIFVPSEGVVFTLFYILISTCLVLPPSEFVSAGITIQNLFSGLLGSENQEFIEYHQRRIAVTYTVHSLLPLGYVFGVFYIGFYDPYSILWKGGVILSVLLPGIVTLMLCRWYFPDFKRHPIIQELSMFCNPGSDWKAVAASIDAEHSRVDKVIIHTSSVVKIIVTDNWIVKVGPYSLKVAHQSDSVLAVKKSDTHHHNPTSRSGGGIQYLEIEVKGRTSFTIRLESRYLRDLEQKLSRPIQLLQNISIHRTVTEKFLEALREQVNLNSTYETAVPVDNCIGCFQASANIKLVKQCGDNSATDNSCTSCFCRPMWCFDCIGKWFASRQDQELPEEWMSAKCTCPLCRSKFCILDISFVRVS